MMTIGYDRGGEPVAAVSGSGLRSCVIIGIGRHLHSGHFYKRARGNADFAGANCAATFLLVMTFDERVDLVAPCTRGERCPSSTRARDLTLRSLTE